MNGHVVTYDEVRRLRKLARTCGTWAAARHMMKRGYAVEVAVWVLTRHAWWNGLPHNSIAAA